MKHKRGARGQYYNIISYKEKGKPEKILKEETVAIKLEPADKLVGDANAGISRNRSIKLAVPDSFGTSISASCTVSLSCNQDDRTLLKTAKLCRKILDKLMEEDQEEMAHFVEEMS